MPNQTRPDPCAPGANDCYVRYMPRQIYVSAYMRSVLYTDECGRNTAGQHLIMRPRQLAYDVLNAVAGDRLETGRWRRAQSTPKVLASTVYPATLLAI